MQSGALRPHTGLWCCDSQTSTDTYICTVFLINATAVDAGTYNIVTLTPGGAVQGTDVVLAINGGGGAAAVGVGGGSGVVSPPPTGFE